MRAKLRNKAKLKGQSTLEYIIVLTAIVALILWAAWQFFGYQGSGNPGAIGQSLDKAEQAIDRAADRFDPGR